MIGVSKRVKRSALPAFVAALGLGVAPVLADPMVWDDPLTDGAPFSGDWLSDNWDEGNPWVDGDAFFSRPGLPGAEDIETRTITINEGQNVNVGILYLEHGGTANPPHIHHFLGDGTLTLGQILAIPDTSSNNARGTAIFDVSISAPNGLLISGGQFGASGTATSASTRNIVVLNAANNITGSVNYRMNSTASPETDTSYLVLGHSDALAGATQLTIDSVSSSTRSGYLALQNDITIAQNIHFISGNGNTAHMVNSGDNTLAGVITQDTFSTIWLETGSSLTFAGSNWTSNGTRALNIRDPGTFIVNGTAPNAPVLTVNAGAKVLVNGTWSTSIGNRVDVNNTGTLGGTGTLTTDASVSGDNGLNVFSGGTLTPGDVGTTGTLTVDGAITFHAGSTLLMDLSDSVGGDNDLLDLVTTRTNFRGRLRINDGALLEVSAIDGSLALDTYRLVEFNTVILTDINNGFTLVMPPGYEGSSLVHGNGFIDLVVIPEPGSLALLGLGGLLMLRRRRGVA